MSRPDKSTVLVTGGAGYVGSHVCKSLAGSGYTPVVYDNLVSGHKEFVRWGELVTGDIADAEKVKAAVARFECSSVIHLAGYIDVGESQSHPGKYYGNNVAATLMFLNALRDCGVSRFIFSSSASVYGAPTRVPIPETHPTQPESVYGRTKLMIEIALRDLAESGEMGSIILRYFNAAGASSCGTIGEDHQPETHLVPRACLAALLRISALDVYGNDFPTQDGTAIRDYVHVEDVAAAHVAALELQLNRNETQTFNIGNGAGHSVREVIDCVGRVAGLSVPVRAAPRRKGDVPVLVADPSSAVNELGWLPKYRQLEDIVSSAWEWHQRRHGTCA